LETVELLRSKIKARIERYLEVDTEGIRSFVMKILLRMRQFTVDDMYRNIKSKFGISYSAVASMIGYIYSKLGILHACKKSYKTPTIYSLKEEYIDLVKAALDKPESAAV